MKKQKSAVPVPEFQRCFDCPKAKFRMKQYSVCEEAKRLGLDDKRIVKSQTLSPTCPLGYKQTTCGKEKKHK